MSYVDTVKSSESGVQSYVSQSESGTSEVSLLGEYLLHPVQGCKHRSHCLVIGLLPCSKPSFVDTVVDVPGRRERG